LDAQQRDSDADRVIATLPPEKQDYAQIVLTRALLRRGDLAGARVTWNNLSSKDQWGLRAEMLDARVRAGESKQVVEQAITGSHEADFVAVFTALVKNGRLDDALNLFSHLPPPNDPRRPHLQHDELAIMLAKSLADANRTAEAEKLMASLSQPSELLPSEADRVSNAQWAIAAAKLRHGDMAGYSADRQPLVDALSQAGGGMPRLEAQCNLLLFDIGTGNDSGAEATASQVNTPEASEGLARVLLMQVLSQGDQNAPDKVDLRRRRSLVRVLAALPYSKVLDAMISEAAYAHAAQGRQADWFDFALTLHDNYARAEANCAMADALLIGTKSGKGSN
jgi:hypothetical protein